MQSLSFKKKADSMEADMQNLTDWCQRFQDNANRQGSLDCKYASDRYLSGVKKVEEFMAKKHKVILQENFQESHAHIANLAHGMNSGDRQPLLDSDRLNAAMKLCDECLLRANGIVGLTASSRLFDSKIVLALNLLVSGLRCWFWMPHAGHRATWKE